MLGYDDDGSPKVYSVDNFGRDFSSVESEGGGNWYEERDDCVLDAWFLRTLVAGYGLVREVSE